MNNMIRQEGTNIGGSDSFWFAPVSDILYIPDPIEGIIPEDIVMNGDATFSQGYAVLNTLAATDDPNENSQGLSYPQSIVGRHPKDIPEIAYLFSQMFRKRFIVVKRANNDTAKVYGTLKNGLRFRYKTLDPADTAGFNGYEYEFYNTYDDFAPFYSGNLVVNNQVVESSYNPPTIMTIGGRWWFGTTAPTSAIGKDGDGFIDYTTNLYYERVGNTWTLRGYLGPKQTWQKLSFHYSQLVARGYLRR